MYIGWSSVNIFCTSYMSYVKVFFLLLLIIVRFTLSFYPLPVNKYIPFAAFVCTLLCNMLVHLRVMSKQRFPLWQHSC